MSTKQKTEIVVTGMGVASPLGLTIDDFWTGILKGESVIREWDDLKELDFKYVHACRIEAIACNPLRRGYHLAKHAVDAALQMASLDNKQRIGLYIGTTMGESGAYEAYAEGRLTNHLHDYSGDSIGKTLQKEIQGIEVTQCFATACAAGNYAIQAGMRALANQQIEIAIVGGVDPFSKIAMTGFSRSRAMSPSGICRPFSAERDGMILGEGAGFLVLQRAENVNKHQTVYARIDGCALSCDAYHATAPKPDSSGIIRCFEQLLATTDTAKDQIDWICAHGTGTKLSDASESQAIESVFHNNVPMVSSLKAHMGHTLGAATALEAIVSVLSIHHNVIPPTANTKKSGFSIPTTSTPITKEVQHVLNCGYAFGGLNSITQFSSWN